MLRLSIEHERTAEELLAESDIDHYVCCVVEELGLPGGTLCGVNRDDGAPIEDGDANCVVCCELVRTNYCPVQERCKYSYGT